MIRPPLPIKRDLALAYVASLVIAIAMTAASVVGLLSQSSTDPAKLHLSFASTDGSNLIVALPMLLSSMWLARRGSLIGLLCWPGALFYVVAARGRVLNGRP